MAIVTFIPLFVPEKCYKGCAYRSTEEGQHVLRQAAVLRLGLQALVLRGHGRGRPLQMSDRDSVQLLPPAQRMGKGVNGTLSQLILRDELSVETSEITPNLRLVKLI